MSVFTLLLGMNSVWGQTQALYIQESDGNIRVLQLSIQDNKARLFSKTSLSQELYQEFSRSPGTNEEKLRAMNDPRTVFRIKDTQNKVYSKWGIWVTKEHYKNTTVFLPEGQIFHEKSTWERTDKAKPAWAIMALYLTLLVIFLIIGRDVRLDSKPYPPIILFGVSALLIALELGIALNDKIPFVFLFLFALISILVLLNQYLFFRKEKILFGFKNLETSLRAVWSFGLHFCIVLVSLARTLNRSGKFGFEFEFTDSYFIGTIIIIPIIAFALGYFFAKTSKDKMEEERKNVMNEMTHEVQKKDNFPNIGPNMTIIS